MGCTSWPILPCSALAERSVALHTVLRLVGQLAETSLCITEGQHLDLSFERRDDVSPAEYLDMIAASRPPPQLLHGCRGARRERRHAHGGLAQYGHQLGLGFQIRDDILGIWGRSETTGKPAGDLYRKKDAADPLRPEPGRGEKTQLPYAPCSPLTPR